MKKVFFVLFVGIIFWMGKTGLTAEAANSYGDLVYKSNGSYYTVNTLGNTSYMSRGQTATPANPVHHCTKENDGSDYTDWSYVYFGSYPQTEVTGSALTSAITGADYDANGDAWVNGTKYRRISKSDTNNSEYFGDSIYRYFKWERMKWRVLENDGSTLFVMADKGVDCKAYHEEDTSITWENCTLRSWLNDSFYNTAFSSREQEAVVRQTVANEDGTQYATQGRSDTNDEVYLLSYGEVTNSRYGFCEDCNIKSASRRIKASDYAYAMGAWTKNDSNYVGNCYWWLRSPGYFTDYAVDVSHNGYVIRYGDFVNRYNYAVVPALHINLSSNLWLTEDNGTSGDGGIVSVAPTVSNPASQSVKEGTSAAFSVNASGGNPNSYTYRWYYATSQDGTGTQIIGATSSSYSISSATSNMDGRYYYCVVSNGIYNIVSSRAKLTVYSEPDVSIPLSSPANPVHHCTKKNDGSDYTDWSYVYFGSYPQTEVTGSALTSAIIGADYDPSGDAWVNGTKYRRISKSDTNNSENFGDSTYRYFKWERMKWRVLKNDGNTLFVMADKGLDCKAYHEEYTSITWENCMLRGWLNSSFYNTAFSSREQRAIVGQTVVNEDNPEHGTKGGNNTNDKVYLLSIRETTNPIYGFCETYSTYSASRHIKASDYVHALGAYTNIGSNYVGNCCWWLRSPGHYVYYAADVNYYGYVDRSGGSVAYTHDVVVPALHINLSSDLWLTEDDGTSGDGGIVPVIPTVSNPASQSVKEGDRVDFSVSASGGNPANYTYQWYYATSQSGTGTLISGATSSSYLISSATSDMDGRYYYCVVSNGIYEVTSDKAKLTVYSAPSVTSPSSQSVKEGNSAAFSVSVSGGNPSNYTYQWYYATSQNGTGTLISGVMSSSYLISSATSDMDGSYYYCVVSNGQYEVESSRAKLTVYNAPSVTSPSSQSVKEGKSVAFSVSASGGVPNSYTYQWYYATSPSGAGTLISGATSSSYLISSATSDMEGRYYYCVVGNGQYEVASSRAKLTVTKESKPPENDKLQAPKTQKIKASSYTKSYGSKPFLLNASTDGDGKLTYKSSNTKIVTVSSGGKVTIKNYGTAKITIKASNTTKYKAAEKTVTIKVIPKRPAMPDASSVAKRKISIKWKKDETVTRYELNISQKSDFKSHTIMRNYDVSKTKVSVVGFPSGKEYYIRMRSYKMVGKSKYYSNWSDVKKVKVK